MKRAIPITLVALVLAACSSATSSAPATLPASTASLPALPTAPATLPPPTATATPEPAEVTGVSFAQLLDAKHGWAIAGQGLFWTEDAGQHWHRVTPDVASAARIGNAFYLDPQHAWVLVCEAQNSDSVLKVAYTTDGGTNWEMSELASVAQLTAFADNQWCGRVNLGHLFFLDAQQGWVMVDHTETMNSYIGEMFQTLDGGQTWHRLGASPSGEFRFVSRDIGWMRATCCTGGAFQLYRTRDGGKSWEAERVNDSGQDDDFFLPAFFEQQVGILPLILRDNGVPGEGITFFESRDDGTTWKSTGKLALVSDALRIGRVIDVQVLNDQTWAVSSTGNGVFWTTDGGQNWVENKTATSILRLALGSSTSGWGLECDEGAAPECVRLVMTEDMGQHWTRIYIRP